MKNYADCGGCYSLRTSCPLSLAPKDLKDIKLRARGTCIHQPTFWPVPHACDRYIPWAVAGMVMGWFMCAPCFKFVLYWIYWHTDHGNSWSAFPSTHVVGELLCSSQPTQLPYVLSGADACLKECFALVWHHDTSKGPLKTTLSIQSIPANSHTLGVSLTPAGWKLRSHPGSRLRANFSRLIEKCELLPSCLTQFPKIC